MPNMCFSYQLDLPPCIESGAAAPSGLRRMPAGSCFSYTADVPRRMPIGGCFSYTADAPQLAAPGQNRKTYTTCFRY
jgi:hypothetical protein